MINTQTERVVDDVLSLWKYPERVVMAVCRRPGGGANIITLAWKMRTSFRPPLLAISVGLSRFSHGLILREKEFVLAVPGEKMAQAALFCGTNTGEKLDKFQAAALTPLPARLVGAPLIAEAAANFECRVTGSLKTGDHTIFTAEIVSAWSSPRPERILLSVADLPGFKVLVEGERHRLGIVAGEGE